MGQPLTMGRQIAARREAKGRGQDVLATMMDTTPRTISRWETDAGTIPLGKQLKLIRLGLLDATPEAEEIIGRMVDREPAGNEPPTWWAQELEQRRAHESEVLKRLERIEKALRKH